MIKNQKIHIPVSKFGFVEAQSDDLQELLDLHDRVANKPLERNNGAFEKINTFTGEVVLYNDASHVYNDLDGNLLVSGSTFAGKHGKKFPREQVMAKKTVEWDMTEKEIDLVWDDNSEMACDFGSSIHKSMENYYLHRDTLAYKLPRHPVLRKIVETFPHYVADYVHIGKKDKIESAPEAMVSCIKRKMVGQIDNLIWIDKKKKIVDIWDYKTAGKLEKDDLYKYSIQINYYRAILEFMGYTVRKMWLQNWNGKWTEYPIKRMDLNKLGKKEVTI